MKKFQPTESLVRFAALLAARRLRRSIGLLAAIVLLPSPVVAQTNLLMLNYQWADSVNGPWTKPPANQTYVQPNGSLLTLATDPQKLFRLTIQGIDFEDVETPVVQVEKLMGETVTIAESHLQWLASNFFGTAGEEPGPWSNARLAPVALKIFDPAYRNGIEPAYIEFKIVSDFQPTEKPAEFLAGNEVAPACDLGHILVSLHEGDVPVPEFSEDGLTPCEELLKRVGSVPNIKIMRFGPTFATVENERGELLANAGTDPFQVPDDFLRYKDQTFKGEFDSETATEAPRDGYGGPKMQATHYATYAKFKNDYVMNPVYQEMRNRKTRAAAAEWVLVRGGTLPQPPVISILVGQSFHAFESQTVTRYFLDDDDEQDVPFVIIDPNTGGDGLAIHAQRVGVAPLTVEIGGQVTHYELRVITRLQLPGGDPAFNAAGGFVPGWQPASTWVAGGGYSDTPRYWQIRDGNLWCPKVGCGPVAWAMLCGWWEHQGAPPAFYLNIPGDFSVIDSPLTLSPFGVHHQAYLHVKGVYALLHDYCDVICETIGGAGATAPGDMIEGGPTYLWLPKIFGHLRYKYSWAWDLTDPDWNEPSNRIRASIKKGRPAIVGLGWLWHYALAYAYRYQEFKLVPNVVQTRRRWFKCNEGWGKSQGAWYSGGDTFLGASINITSVITNTAPRFQMVDP